MLSIFPVQFLAPVAYAVLRLCVGLMLLALARTHARQHTSFAEAFARVPFFPFGAFLVWGVVIAELVAGALLVLGLFTQIGALIAVVYAGASLFLYRYMKHQHGPTRQTLLLILCVALSLFITGPGILAFDLPI